jgi:hypothetical protein
MNNRGGTEIDANAWPIWGRMSARTINPQSQTSQR